jgi:hypothetical protein
MSWRGWSAALAVALLTACSASPSGSAGDANAVARDAVNFFGQLCLSTLGDRQAIEARLAQSAHPIARVPDDQLPSGTHRDAAAWTELSPRGAELRLQVDQTQFCAVDVASADGAALHRHVRAMLDRLYGENGFKYRVVADATDRETRIRREDYLVRLPSQQSALVTVASGTARSPGRITFGYSGNEF